MTSLPGRLGTALLVAAAWAAPVLAQDEQPSLIGRYVVGNDSNAATVELLDDGYHVMIQQGRVGVIGNYTVDGDTVTFEDLAGPISCPAGKRGQYTFESTDKGLRFSLVDEECDGRSQGVAGAEWIKAKE